MEKSAHQWRIWHEQLSRAIYFQTGMLMFVHDLASDSRIYRSWESLAEREDGFRFMSLKEARERFPQFTLSEGDTLVYDSWTGYLRSGQAVADLAALARAEGVQILEETPVRKVEETTDRVRIVCDDDALNCDRAVIAAGTVGSPSATATRPPPAYHPQPDGIFHPRETRAICSGRLSCLGLSFLS